MPEAVAQYREALRLKPDYAEAHNSLVNRSGAEHREHGSLEAIAPVTRRRSASSPIMPRRTITSGSPWERSGRTADAIAQFEAALHFKPDYADAHNNLGVALRDTGRTAEAVAQFEEAARLRAGPAPAQW